MPTTASPHVKRMAGQWTKSEQQRQVELENAEREERRIQEELEATRQQQEREAAMRPLDEWVQNPEVWARVANYYRTRADSLNQEPERIRWLVRDILGNAQAQRFNSPESAFEYIRGKIDLVSDKQRGGRFKERVPYMPPENQRTPEDFANDPELELSLRLLYPPLTAADGPLQEAFISAAIRSLSRNPESFIDWYSEQNGGLDVPDDARFTLADVRAFIASNERLYYQQAEEEMAFQREVDQAQQMPEMRLQHDEIERTFVNTFLDEVDQRYPDVVAEQTWDDRTQLIRRLEAAYALQDQKLEQQELEAIRTEFQSRNDEIQRELEENNFISAFRTQLAAAFPRAMNAGGVRISMIEHLREAYNRPEQRTRLLGDIYRQLELTENLHTPETPHNVERALVKLMIEYSDLMEEFNEATVTRIREEYATADESSWDDVTNRWNQYFSERRPIEDDTEANEIDEQDQPIEEEIATEEPEGEEEEDNAGQNDTANAEADTQAQRDAYIERVFETDILPRWRERYPVELLADDSAEFITHMEQLLDAPDVETAQRLIAEWETELQSTQLPEETTDTVEESDEIKLSPEDVQSTIEHILNRQKTTNDTLASMTGEEELALVIELLSISEIQQATNQEDLYEHISPNMLITLLEQIRSEAVVAEQQEPVLEDSDAEVVEEPDPITEKSAKKMSKGPVHKTPTPVHNKAQAIKPEDEEKDLRELAQQRKAEKIQALSADVRSIIAGNPEAAAAYINLPSDTPVEQIADAYAATYYHDKYAYQSDSAAIRETFIKFIEQKLGTPPQTNNAENDTTQDSEIPSKEPAKSSLKEETPEEPVLSREEIIDALRTTAPEIYWQHSKTLPEEWLDSNVNVTLEEIKQMILEDYNNQSHLFATEDDMQAERTYTPDEDELILSDEEKEFISTDKKVEKDLASFETTVNETLPEEIVVDKPENESPAQETITEEDMGEMFGNHYFDTLTQFGADFFIFHTDRIRALPENQRRAAINGIDMLKELFAQYENVTNERVIAAVKSDLGETPSESWPSKEPALRKIFNDAVIAQQRS